MERIEIDETLSVRLDHDHAHEVCIGVPGRASYLMKRTWQEFRVWSDSRPVKSIHVVGLAERPGVELWASEMERRYYWPPGTPHGDLFAIHQSMWTGMRWQVVTIPAKHERFAVKVGEAIGLAVRATTPVLFRQEGLVVVGSTGSPEDCEQRGLTRFPVSGPDVRTLEFLKGHALGKIAEAGGGDMLKVAQNMFITKGETSAINQSRDN